MLVALVGGCASPQSAAPTPSPSPLRNPLNVALYPGATVIASRSFHQVVAAPQSSGSIFAAGAGTYNGREVLAASDASFAQLSSWVRRLDANPHADTLSDGFDYATFQRGSGRTAHGVLVIVMDPQQVDRRFGSVLGMIAHYRAMPDFMRGPIDDQVKARFGITLSDAMQPTSPLGATLGALDEFRHRNARGIAIIGATRR